MVNMKASEASHGISQCDTMMSGAIAYNTAVETECRKRRRRYNGENQLHQGPGTLCVCIRGHIDYLSRTSGDCRRKEKVISQRNPTTASAGE